VFYLTGFTINLRLIFSTRSAKRMVCVIQSVVKRKNSFLTFCSDTREIFCERDIFCKSLRIAAVVVSEIVIQFCSSAVFPLYELHLIFEVLYCHISISECFSQTFTVSFGDRKIRYKRNTNHFISNK
jgi:hypothetical protein